MWPSIMIAVVVIGWLVLFSNYSSQVREAKLLEKYGDPAIVEFILRGGLWIVQSAEQLRDSRGSLADIDQKVLKTKTNEIWKCK